MSLIPNYVPSGYKTVNVMLTVKNAEKALEFYNRAFGAEVIQKLVDPQGVVVHAEMKIADTVIMLAEEDPRYNQSPESLGGSSVIIQLYTEDVEGLYEDAVKAGAKEIFPIKVQFYGDRAGRVQDPFGHQWILATHMETLSPTELQHRFHELYP